VTPRAQKTLLGAALALAAGGVFVAVRRDGDGSVSSASSTPVAGSAPVAATPAAFDRANPREKFVGSAACAPCHRAQAEAYSQSHHALALVKPARENVLARFDGTSLSTPLGGPTRFAERNGAFEVTSANAGGKSETFSVAYVAGVFPLQQYVVGSERGKLQSLGVAWDSRAKADGGERWFHVYGPKGIAHDDSLFFTEPAQNWNHVCADCHSTFVERRYDVSSDRFDTRWAESSVGCEACHGPGADHVRAAKDAEKRGTRYGGALAVRLKLAAPWSPGLSGSPDNRRQDGVEVEVCAPCHSRREPLHEGFLAGDAFLDAFEPELLRRGRYHADGQVEGEVYEWGSFPQSKMFASGVRCSDCHEPHSASLRAPGNQLCAKCHASTRFEGEAHSHHTGAKAPLCVDCHMPPSTFMQIDERRDHSIRIPRPDHSVEFGTPNACTLCHSKESAIWARDHVARWYPGSSSRPHFASALMKDRKGSLDAPRLLSALAQDETAPAIARATALERLGEFPTKGALESLRAALSSPDALVVFGAVLGARNVPLPERARLLVPVAEHRVRAVRVAVGKALAGVPIGELDPKARAALERAFADAEASFGVSASLPQSHVERSSFELARKKPDAAEAEVHIALRLAPCLVEAHLNLADLARQNGNEALAESAIRKAIACDPKNASAHHALGLLQVRTKSSGNALLSLKKAVELAPRETRFGFVLAVALADGGDLPAAVKALESALETRRNDPELLRALAGYLDRLGERARAADVGRRLETLLGE
jgi:predicted CXXCH cytochrome family protein